MAHFGEPLFEGKNMETSCRHVAIIMDGNGRWAKKQDKQRTFGHLSGSENVRNIALAANKLDIKVLTLYAFSTENWKRPMEEVDYLMKLPEVFFNRFIDELMREGIKIMAIGDLSRFPANTQRVLQNAIDKTRNNSGLILNFAMNYGGRDEIIRAVNAIADDVLLGKVDRVDETVFESYLMTAGLPPVDLMIRTSGEQRISNFLLWQLAYAELVFTNVAWPDFREADLVDAINVFENRNRRFGGL
jgi:undecaprenyl diphosphate synthase